MPSGYDEAIYAGMLRRVPMFSACSNETIEHLVSLATPHSVEAGTDLVREGDAGDELFVIMHGEASIRRGGEEVARISDGDFFGELSLLDPAPRSATVTAVTPVTAVGLHRAQFQAALDEIPTMRDALLQGMARRLHELVGKA
jgi:CRP-like cAMP-binding protein